MMGSGKTQAMYAEIRNNPDKSYMVVTPYLKTIQDAKSENLNIYEPEYKGGTKMDSLKYLLSHGYNICCTHSLFLDVDNEIWDLIHDGGYTLFIDEALDVVKPINDLIDDIGYQVKKGTATFLINQGVIHVDEFCRVTWCGKPTLEDYEYKYLEPLIKSGNVLCVKGQLFLWMFPPEVFRAFENVFILSYLFEGSVFDGYLKIHSLDYKLGGVSGQYGDAHGFSFSEYREDSENRKALQQVISIYDGVANAIGEKKYALSSTWYSTATSTDLKAVQKGFNTFYKATKNNSRRLMWTTYKDYQDALCIYGAKYIRKLTKDEKYALENNSKSENTELNKLQCFVSCSCRATNDYADRNMLAYLVNRFYNPLIKGMFRDKYNIRLNEDRFALSEMIQWIWRSRIRKNQLPLEERNISLYIPSQRMRNLMRQWLSGKAI